MTYIAQDSNPAFSSEKADNTSGTYTPSILQSTQVPVYPWMLQQVLNHHIPQRSGQQESLQPDYLYFFVYSTPLLNPRRNEKMRTIFPNYR